MLKNPYRKDASDEEQHHSAHMMIITFLIILLIISFRGNFEKYFGPQKEPTDKTTTIPFTD